MWLVLLMSLSLFGAHAGDVEELEADVEANVFESEAAEKAAQREAQRLEQDRVDYKTQKFQANQTITDATLRSTEAKKKLGEVHAETKKITSEMASLYKARDFALKDLEKSQAELSLASGKLMKVRKEMAKVKAQTEQARYEADQNRQLAADNEKRRVRLEKEHKEFMAKNKGKFAGTVQLKPSGKRTPASTK